MLPAFLATVLFSVSVVAASRTTRMVGAVPANLCRLCVATALLAVWAHLPGRGFGGGAFWIFFLSGCIGFGLGDLALYQTLPRLGPRLTILMVHCLAAPMAALAEWLWLGTALTSTQIFCGLIILAGVAIALAPSEHVHLAPAVLTAGIVFGIVAALGQGLGAVVSRKAYAVVAEAGQSIDGLTAAYQRILGGLIFTLPPSIWIMLKHAERAGDAGGLVAATSPARNRWRAARPWILLNALAGPAIGVGCYQWALETTPSGVVLPIVATTPIVVIPLAIVLEGERPSARSVLGGVLAVAGAVGLTLAR